MGGVFQSKTVNGLAQRRMGWGSVAADFRGGLDNQFGSAGTGYFHAEEASAVLREDFLDEASPFALGQCAAVPGEGALRCAYGDSVPRRHCLGKPCDCDFRICEDAGGDVLGA